MYEADLTSPPSRFRPMGQYCQIDGGSLHLTPDTHGHENLGIKNYVNYRRELFREGTLSIHLIPLGQFLQSSLFSW
ncbi:hypothetical protein B5V00_13585 [Geothermobacter hydrogeniphilus]|uniref:Uncharacterized protein n=1 Tax=Geothermobacter hydrogeniphilus TaxID=1969733 RepID=A0A1X0XX67_9BACT|nr:hypothetical protein B5V00_13585 [Geothermobacter hydrogeniphilus]